jgi:hypothetical protein
MKEMMQLQHLLNLPRKPRRAHLHHLLLMKVRKLEEQSLIQRLKNLTARHLLLLLFAILLKSMVLILLKFPLLARMVEF